MKSIPFGIIAAVSLSHAHKQQTLTSPNTTLNSIPPSTRAHWMRVANRALSDLLSPCPFAAFGTAIVNHSAASPSAPLGTLVCIGANSISATGNPTQHGEIAALDNCTAVLGAAPYSLSAGEIQAAWADLSLYTNAESCPMCASAIRWAGFREYVYGTSIGRLTGMGWAQIQIASAEVFERSWGLGTGTRLLGEVLTNETDAYFSWQYQEDYPCPRGCARKEGTCMPV